MRQAVIIAVAGALATVAISSQCRGSLVVSDMTQDTAAQSRHIASYSYTPIPNYTSISLASYSPASTVNSFTPVLLGAIKDDWTNDLLFDGRPGLNSDSERFAKPDVGQKKEIKPATKSAVPAENISPPSRKHRLTMMQFGAPMLAPLTHSVFCLQYPGDCRVHKIVFRSGPLKLTSKRWAELVAVNRDVNQSIIPKANTEGVAGEKWLISPKSGDCGNFAVTKRHKLLALGWPARDLLLSEVVVPSGEHHLVLVIRTTSGDLVADNLSPNIRNWSATPYQWVRIESPSNPQIWSTVSRATVWAKAPRLADFES